jgi:MFS family permease
MNKSSIWTALRNPAFRKLWIATVISGICVAAHDNTATWMMNGFTGSPFLISLMSTVASLPFFLFTLPAGAIADKVDRRNLICFINVGLAATAVSLAVLGWLHLLNPYFILLSVFCIGVGFAFNAPAWTSIVPQVVSDEELPLCSDLEWFAIQHLGDYWTSARWFIDSDGRSQFCLCTECRLLLPRCPGSPSMETTICASKTSVGEIF